MAPRPATVLHTSDCHLGGSGRADGREELAFAAMAELAMAEAVDVVLVAGDLFDHARVSEATLDFAAQQLGRLDCPVVLLVGNHDALHDRSVHHRFEALGRGDHVLLLDDPAGSSVAVPGTDVVVWGRAMVEHEPAYRPFAGVPARPADVWSIAAGHGLVVTTPTPDRSSTIPPEDLDAVHWDYVALGHIHDHRVVRDQPAPVVYPGATATSRRGEPGVVLVAFAPGLGATPRWVPLPVPTD